MNTIENIQSLQKFGSRLGLERIDELTDLLGKPQEGLDFIHIAGTNGKGSVSTYIYSVLRANGYNVGMFTSPFMESFRDSIIVNDEPMSKDEMDSFYSRIHEAIDDMVDRGLESPTEFEVITTLALMYFAKKTPDFVIMEVGLGGIGDSTNILGSPLLSAITSVSMDHCDVLGDTIEAIANEKAGIIKNGVPVLSNVTDKVATKVIARVAYEKKAPLIDVTKFDTRISESDSNGSQFSVQINGINYPQMKISMVGEHQVRNAVCALAIIEQLRKQSRISLNRENTLQGLEYASLAGRFEIINRCNSSAYVSDLPLIIMDGAHNTEGAAALEHSLLKLFPNKRILTIFSLMKDKKADDVVTKFLGFSDELIIADILPDKPIDTDGLSKLVGNKCGGIIKSKDEIINKINTSNDYDIILITGSLYLIRELRISVYTLCSVKS
jgi:dihydrofolate synthase/folylpolyglutamate synthase